MSFAPWMLAAMDQAGYNGIDDDHIETVAAELRRSGKTEISRADFNAACYRNGIDPTCFTRSELSELERALNR